MACAKLWLEKGGLGTDTRSEQRRHGRGLGDKTTRLHSCTSSYIVPIRSDAHVACDEGGAPRARGALMFRVRHEGDGAAEDEETEEHGRL